MLQRAPGIEELSFGLWNFHVLTTASHVVVVKGAANERELQRVARWRMDESEVASDGLTVVGQVAAGPQQALNLRDLGVPDRAIVTALDALKRRGGDPFGRTHLAVDAKVDVREGVPVATMAAEFNSWAVLEELANHFAAIPKDEAAAPAADRPMPADTAGKLRRIRDLLSEAEQVWSTIPREEQDRISDDSDLVEEASLRHVLLKGEKGAEIAIEVERAERGMQP